MEISSRLERLIFMGWCMGGFGAGIGKRVVYSGVERGLEITGILGLSYGLTKEIKF
jgi:hypothetical protein